jgi:hypothetical protein
MTPLPIPLAQALTEFNAQAYFACHETLEALWLKQANPTERLFLQGWLQVAVGLYHAQRGNRTGARNKLRQGLDKLHTTQPHWQPLLPTMAQVMADCESFLARLAVGPQDTTFTLDIHPLL